MSKIAEQKALEAYPIKHIVLPFCFSIPDLNEPYRKPYREGYEQAMKDVFEWIEKKAYLDIPNVKDQTLFSMILAQECVENDYNLYWEDKE